MLLLAGYYFWTAAPCSSWHTDCSPNPRRLASGDIVGPYNVLAASFLSGQVSLVVPPDPRLLRLPDPYDPRQNAPFRWHDVSLYNGNYYLYFGPAPALFVFVPYLFVTGEYLPDALGCALLALGAYIATCLCLRLLLRTFVPKRPTWVLPCLCAGAGFCNTYPYLLRRPAAYEIAIAGGQCFLMTAVLLLSRVALGASRRPRLEAILGGAMCACAFASRPQLLMAETGIFLMLAMALAEGRRWRLFAAALAPLIAGGLMIALYNYIRFDSPFEFGEHYVLAGTNMAKLTVFHASRLPISLFFYALRPPGLSSSFPFFRAESLSPFPLPADYVGLEQIVGIVWLSPLVLVLVGLPWLWRRQNPDRDLARWALAFLASSVAVVCVDGALGATMRYHADYSSLIFLAGGIVAARLLVVTPAQFLSAARAALVVLISFGIICNSAIGITGYYDNLRVSDPEQYRALESLFQPVSHVLAALGVAPAH